MDALIPFQHASAIETGADGAIELTTPAGARVALSGVGAAIWTRFKNGRSPDAIATELSRVCGIPIERTRQDVVSLMNTLMEHLLLRTSPHRTPVTEVSRRQFGRYFDDPECRTWLCGGRVLFELGPDRAMFTHSLFRTRIADRLFDQQLVLRCELAEGRTDEGRVTLTTTNHVRVSYWFEWCQVMWKDAILHALDVLIALTRQQLTLSTIAPWHLQYANGRPVYLSLGSIVPFTPDALLNCFDKMRRYFVPALLLAAEGKGALARTILRGSVNRGIEDSLFPAAREVAESWRAGLAARPNEIGLFELRAQIERVRLTAPKTRWTDWQQNGHSPESWTHRQRLVSALLELDRPTSVTDLGANSGWYSCLAASRGCDVVAVESDEECANQLHASKTGSIVPIVLDLVDPTPALGPNYDWFQPATERLQSDIVLALALVDLLVFSRYRLTFADVVSALKAFTKRTLLVEFMPLEDPTRYDVWWPGSSSWYNLETFVTVLRGAFATVTVLQPIVNGRALIVCDRH